MPIDNAGNSKEGSFGSGQESSVMKSNFSSNKMNAHACIWLLLITYKLIIPVMELVSEYIYIHIVNW